MKTLRRNLPLLLVALLTLGLFLYPYLKPEPAAEGPPKDDKSAPTPVRVARVTRQALTQRYQAVATVQGQREVAVLAQAAGVLLQVRAQAGDRVRQGQSLGELDGRQQQAALRGAQAQLVRSTDEYRRASTLAARRLANQTRLTSARSQQAADQAEVSRLQTLLSFTRLLSPLTGVVTREHALAGTAVREGDPVLTVADVRRLVVVARVPEAVAPQLRPGDAATLYVEATGDTLPGRVLRVSPAADPAAHQVSVEVDAGATYPRLKPGYQVTVVLRTAGRPDALALDRRALTDDPSGGQATVFVVQNGRAHPRRVRLGLVLERQVEVLSGLRAGDQVVYHGGEKLKDDAPVRVVGDEALTAAPKSAN